MKDFDQQLKTAHRNLARKQKIEIHLKNLDVRIQEQKTEVHRLEQIVQAERKDILELEKQSLRNLFIKILKDRTQELEREKQEYLMAVLKLQGIQKNLEQLIFEKEILNQQLSGLFNAEKEFEKLYRKKAKLFESDILIDEATLVKIQVLEKRILGHRSRIHEIKEAISAGKKTEHALQKIKDELHQIQNWGLYVNDKSDLELFGKGKDSSYGKKKYLNVSLNIAHRANIALEKFETEILDIEKHFELDYRPYIQSFKDFLHILYDHLITDWIVKKNAENALIAIETIFDKVQRILAMLQNEISKTENYISEEQQQIKTIITEY